MDGWIGGGDASQSVSQHNTNVPICVQTISVTAPMNWGVAFRFRRRQSSSTILPTANHRAALSCYFFCFCVVVSECALTRLSRVPGLSGLGALASRTSSTDWSAMVVVV